MDLDSQTPWLFSLSGAALLLPPALRPVSRFLSPAPTWAGMDSNLGIHCPEEDLLLTLASLSFLTCKVEMEIVKTE